MRVNIPMKAMMGSMINAVQNANGSVSVTTTGSRYDSQPVTKTLSQDEFISKYGNLIDTQTDEIFYGDTFESNLGNFNFNENLNIRNYKTSFTKGYQTIQGSINDKVASLQGEEIGLFAKEATFTGTFGKEDAWVKMYDKNKIGGWIGEKYFDLEFKTGLFTNKFNITGTIDGKEINISNNSKVEDALCENDILALCASMKGYSFNIKDGKFNGLELSEYSQQQADIRNAQNNALCFAYAMQM